MANCPLTLSGIDYGCKDNVGGIKEIYLNDYGMVSAKTLTNSAITAITQGANKFKKYYFRKQTAQMVSTVAVNEQNATVVVTTDLTMKFNKLDTAKQTEIMQLAKGETCAIVLDNNGKYWYLGYDFPLTLSAGKADSGVQFTDANGYELTLQGMEKQLPYEVSSTVIATLF